MRTKAKVFTIVATLLVASCEKKDSSLANLPEDPNDLTTAIFRIEEGKPVICIGKLHSHRFRKLCVGDYPRVSPSGRYVAYNQSLPTGIAPIKVIEVQTGKVRTFDSIPHDLQPWPESFWSKDESLIAFEVHDFAGNRVKCVVSMADGSFWRGTGAEFRTNYPDAFNSINLNARRSVEGRLVIENFKHVGALFFQTGKGGMVRLTPEDMAVASPPIWIERTGEALFVGRRVVPPYDDKDVMSGNVYLIKPEAKDWANASKKDWEAAIVTMGEQVSCSH
jgi:hypothetical protein